MEASSSAEAASPPTNKPPAINDRCKVFCAAGDQHLAAVILERRRKDRKRKQSDDDGALKADEMEYYVHYVEHDRRLDEWVTLDKIQLDTLERAAVEQHTSDNEEDRFSRRRSSASALSTGDHHHNDNNNSNEPFSLSGGNFHVGRSSNNPATAAFEREHEETTKVKNIEKIIMGSWQVAAWYYSPFPADYSDVETLYVCEFCLTYMKFRKTLRRHKAECTCRTPPGREIYRDDTNLAVYELDGKDHRVYCQKLCLLAKLFLDHKTLYYDVTPFFFYVVTKVDSFGSHIVGYFSKEKVSSEGYNLACILTFPQYQKAGYGKFIISLSYELTKREGMTGSPEKPLSDLGKVSYRSFWTYILMNLLAAYDGTGDLTINDMTSQTGIKTEDIISTLQYLDMIKVWKGQHVIYVKQGIIEDYMKKKKQFRLCKPQFLKWEPPAQASRIK